MLKIIFQSVAISHPNVDFQCFVSFLVCVSHLILNTPKNLKHTK